MKVKELIKILKEFNKDAIVYVIDKNTAKWIDIYDVEEESTNIVTIGLKE